MKIVRLMFEPIPTCNTLQDFPPTPTHNPWNALPIIPTHVTWHWVRVLLKIRPPLIYLIQQVKQDFIITLLLVDFFFYHYYIKWKGSSLSLLQYTLEKLCSNKDITQTESDVIFRSWRPRNSSQTSSDSEEQYFFD